jgi:23S rRNA (guanosine2251-2'-O)-methyltransferase
MQTSRPFRGDRGSPKRHRQATRSRSAEQGERWLYGRHPVVAALANPERRWRRLAVLAGQEDEAKTLVAAAHAEWSGDGEPIRVLDRRGFAALVGEDAVHQGLALEVEPLDEPDLDDVLRAAELAARAVVVVLDQVNDPHNVGAVLRAAAAFGALGVIVAAHGAPPAGGALAKAASGALDLVPLIPMVNLARTLERLKAAGFWCCGLDERAPLPLAELELGPRVALVLGAEGDGLRRLVRESCDYLARLPTAPQMPSLNVSAAAAIALYALQGKSGA